jgi:type VI secretion system secreted protein Hcp
VSQDEANQIARATQRMRRSRGALKLALPTAAALGAGAAIAVGAIPGSDGTITGCYLTNTAKAPGLRDGQLRIIDLSLPSQLPTGGPNPAGACLSDESPISWSQSGPSGPQGATGAAGGQGTPGAPGSPGVNGQQQLVPAVQFGFDNSAGTMFLKLDGVQGESSDSKHKGDIEISSFSFGAGNVQAHGSGGGAGKTSFSSFTITKHVDKTSPQLQLSALSGKHYKEADVFFARKAGKGQQDYLKIKLDDVLISSYQTGGHAGGAIPTETIALDGIKGEATFISGNKRSNVLLKLQGGA